MVKKISEKKQKEEKTEENIDGADPQDKGRKT